MTTSIGKLVPGAMPLWVSIEGINGVGKTSAARSVAATLGARCLLLDELTDQSGDSLPGRVIAALNSYGDPFLRTGYPVVETLALLGLQIRKTERLTEPDIVGVDVILEDRGVDSVAVYQAAVLCSQHPGTSPEAVARHVLSSVQRWVTIPDATILLTGDSSVCAGRFADRIGRPLTRSDVHVIEQIDTLYRQAALDDPDLYTLIDVGTMSQEDSAAAVEEIVTTLLERKAAHVS